jgi:hypothetical protein
MNDVLNTDFILDEEVVPILCSVDPAVDAIKLLLMVLWWIVLLHI